jgi:hypothetical protein
MYASTNGVRADISQPPLRANKRQSAPQRKDAIRHIGKSTRVLAPPFAHGTDDRAEVATLCGEDVLSPRGTH